MKTKTGFILLLAISLLGLSSIAVHATPVSLGQVQLFTADGQDFVFNYPGSPASDGTGGTFLFRSRGDYTFPTETATITLEGFGSVVLDESGVVSNAITGLTLIANNTEPQVSTVERLMEYVFDVSPLLLDGLLADGNIMVEVDTSDAVEAQDTYFNFVRVNFDYESATTVPEPGTVALFATGLLGLAGYRWHQRRRGRTHVA